jgi:hypothetical protein
MKERRSKVGKGLSAGQARNSAKEGEPQPAPLAPPSSSLTPHVARLTFHATRLTPHASRLPHLASLVFFLASTLLLTWPLARTPGAAIPGDAFDGWQNLWNLWWMRKALLELHTHPYFTPELYHPSGVTLWFQTLNPFNGLVGLPVQLAGNLFWAYNAIVLFSFTLAGYGAMLLARFVLQRSGAVDGWRLWAAALAAGAIFTFSPFHFAHLLGHMQVFSLELAPFYLLYLLRALPTTPTTALRRRDALLAAFFLVLSGLCDWYLVLYLVLFSLLYVLYLLARQRISRHHIAALTLIFGLFLLATAPLTLPMVAESLRYDFMRPPAGQIAELSADVLGFILPAGQHPLWGQWTARLRTALPASPSENTLYLGLVPVLLSAYGLWRRRLRLGFWAIAALLFAVFALGPVLHIGGRVISLPDGRPLPLPYALLLRLPFLDIARTVARYALIVTLCLGLLAGGGLYTLLLAHPRRWLPALSIGLILFEYAPLPYPISLPDTPAWYHTLAADERAGAVLNLPMTWDRPNYLLFQTVHGKRLTAGYISRSDPRTLVERIPILSDLRRGRPDINAVDPAAYAPTLFAFAGVGWVVADRYQMPAGDEREHVDGLVHVIFQGRPPAYEDERLSVYETWPPSEPLPFIEIGYDWGPLLPGPARQVDAAATLIVHSPGPALRSLAITPAPNSPPYRLLDAAGRQIGASDGRATAFALSLQPGPNTFTLAPDQAGMMVERVGVE